MMLKYRRLKLVKRYLFVSLLLSIIPLVFSAFLYDRYTASLLDNILLGRLDSDVKSASEKIYKFLNTQSDRLDYLADLPKVESILLAEKMYELSDDLLDIIYLGIGSADIYGASFFDEKGRFIRSIPEDSRFSVDVKNINYSHFGSVDIIDPVANSGRPTWFGMRRNVYRNNVKIGSIILKLRLASLTENMSTLYQKDFYDPKIQIGKEVYFSILGTAVQRGEILAQAREIVPGWKVFLSKKHKNTGDSRAKIRYLLLVVVVLSCAAIIAVFLHMSASLVIPLRALTEGARAIAKGDFSARIPEQAPGELGDLAHSFNKMNEQLESMINTRVDAERLGSLGNLAAGIAHEIRNPLTTLRTSVHALRSSEKNVEKQEVFDLIGEEIIRIDGMVENFLSYAKPHEPSIELVVLKDFFRNLKALVSGTLSDASIGLEFLGDQSLSVFIDPAQLRQVFMNLVLNAMQAMPNGGYLVIGVSRGTSEKEKSDEVVITVSDNGIGMDKETLEKVKEPFFTTKAQGSGLGLSICAQLLRKNNGVLEVKSCPGEGTDIIIRLAMKNGKENNE